MFRSLKSKFILYFMGTEVLFLALILGINFTSIDKVAKTLIEEKLATSTELFSKLIAAPVLTLDLAALDDALKSFAKQKNVIAIKVVNLEGVVLSSIKKRDRVLKKHDDVMFGKQELRLLEHDLDYRIKQFHVVVEGEHLGNASILFDTTHIRSVVAFNKQQSYLLLILALLIAFGFAYVVGRKLGRSLNKAASIAHDIAHEKVVKMEAHNERYDEVEELFNALFLMKEMIEKRTQSLNKALKGQEQFLFALDESSIVSKTDPKGRITYVNDRFCEVSGYTQEELIGKSHSIVRHPDMEASFFKNLWETIQAKRVFKGTIKNRSKDGSSYYVDSTLVPIVDIDDNIVEYIAVRYDVTNLVDALKRSQLAERTKSEFLSNMSHEIRTPMNAILGFVHLLQKRLKNETNLSYVETIENSSKLLLHVIDDILDFSKMEHGKLTIESISFDLYERIGHVYELFELKAKEKQIDFVLDRGTEVPQYLYADILRIQQIVTNFLSNAFKFTPEGKRITLVIRFDKDNERLCVGVKDEGIGMDETVKKRIFHAFEQADNSTTRVYGGTGLGLSISSKLAELMQGDIDVTSRVGEGSEFTLCVPVKVEKGMADSLSSQESHKEAFFTAKVLVAEDNKTNQMLIQMLLDELGVKYLTVSNGHEAVEAFQKESFDIVLMDENMPEMNGIVAVEHIRDYEKKQGKKPTPIVAVTANVMHEDQQRFKTAGMDDFIPKPIDPKELQRVFSRFLQKK